MPCNGYNLHSRFIMFYADDERIILVCEALLELSIREPLNIVETGKQFMADVLFFFP